MKNTYFENAKKNKIIISSLILYFFYKFKLMSKFAVVKAQMEICYKKSEKKIYKLLSKTNEFYEEAKESSDTIWFFWGQGIENAPNIVKICYNKAKKLYGNSVILVTLDNLNEYIDMDKDIKLLFESGKLSITSYSDIIRLELLNKYGGTWIDSTCYLSEKIPEYIMSSDFFSFKSGYSNMEIPNFQSWFIHSQSHNILINETLYITKELTKLNGGFKHYFFMFFVFYSVSKKHKKIWENVFSMNENNCYQLNDSFESENNTLVDFYIKNSFIHKLTYKTKNLETQPNYKYFVEKYVD